MRKFKKYLILILVLIGLSATGAIFFQLKEKFSPSSVPLAINYNEAPSLQAKNLVNITADITLPEEVNLNIPFTSQAPAQNWSLPYQQFCEEASVLMVNSYINNQPILNSNDADKKLLAIMDFEIKKFGFYEDTNVSETATIFKEHFGITKVEVVLNPTIENIKSALAEGRAIVVPLAGRELGNPYYQQPGPLYHMLVIKGYKKNGDFITNDPGTKKGADFIYKADVIMKAIHDWNGGNVNAGEKIILVVG
ncbi:MAG: C39 family peptidase [Candidatus Moranbacteria bacterium]|jgi:hypothetical protein|nr:C39 family peptidase [Candidatus Moranbacteria bacterium]